MGLGEQSTSPGFRKHFEVMSSISSDPFPTITSSCEMPNSDARRVLNSSEFSLGYAQSLPKSECPRQLLDRRVGPEEVRIVIQKYHVLPRYGIGWPRQLFERPAPQLPDGRHIPNLSARMSAASACAGSPSERARTPTTPESLLTPFELRFWYGMTFRKS